MNAPYSRRQLLQQVGSGCGALALNALLQSESKAAGDSHHSPKAKSIIWLFMAGGPSGIDLFDYKPELERLDGKPFPGKIKTLFPHPGPVLRPVFKFDKYGECGVTVSEPYQNIAKHVDDICFLKACQSTELNHGPARYLMNSGSNQIGAASIGSWLNYGLGSENKDLPGFVVMYDRRRAPDCGANLWSSGFLPSSTQGVAFKSSGTPVLYLDRPEGFAAKTQRKHLEVLRELNQSHLRQNQFDTRTNDQLEARIRSFETAYRMQRAVPDVVDISKESKETMQLYGLDDPQCVEYGTQLLMARRMVEAGVRFVQIYQGASKTNWDQHGDLAGGHGRLCYESDKPIAGLLTDLKRRGLLDSTLVVWGGEFGRLPISQDRYGRDHNPYGFAMWLAGGGTKRGYTHGELDEFGYKPVSGAVSMHDLHATIMHLMGIDHERLSYYFNGRDQTLTNSLGDVVHDIIA